MWYIAVLILGSSLIAVIYVWRIIEVAYFRPVPAGAAEIKEAPFSMLAPLWILTLASVYFGIDAARTADIAATAAKFLLKGVVQ